MKKQQKQTQKSNKKKILSKTEVEKKLDEIKSLYEMTPDYIDESTKELMAKYSL